MFLLQRELYSLEKGTSAKAGKPEASTSVQPKPVAREKPRVRVKAQSAPALTMAELLRGYGHVPEVRA
jgi:hypothetical protein